MNNYWQLSNILCLILLSGISTITVELQTKQGLIYGQQTESSVEYLG